MSTLLNRLSAKRWQPFHTDERKLAASTKVEAFADPGVYLFAYTSKPMAGRPVKPGNVFYVGMSNSAGGLRQRFRQFQSSLEGGNGHGPAYRFFEKCAKCRPYSRLQTRNRCISVRSRDAFSAFLSAMPIALDGFPLVTGLAPHAGYAPLGGAPRCFLPELDGYATPALAAAAIRADRKFLIGCTIYRAEFGTRHTRITGRTLKPSGKAAAWRSSSAFASSAGILGTRPRRPSFGSHFSVSNQPTK